MYLLSEDLEVWVSNEKIFSSSIHFTNICDFIFLYSWIPFHSACIPYFHYLLLYCRTISMLLFPRFYEKSSKKKKHAWTSIYGVECPSFFVNTRSNISGLHGWYTFNVSIILHTEYNVGIPLSSKPPTNEVFLLPQPCILSSICSFILCLSNWGKMKSQIWFDLT